MVLEQNFGKNILNKAQRDQREHYAHRAHSAHGEKWEQWEHKTTQIGKFRPVLKTIYVCFASKYVRWWWRGWKDRERGQSEGSGKHIMVGGRQIILNQILFLNLTPGGQTETFFPNFVFNFQSICLKRWRI